jgi:hypothetical protein
LGKLLTFDSRARGAKARDKVEAPGQVVLFTGVRYERDPSPEPQKPLGTPSGVKRRRG